jgi:hypothetical protein
MALAPRLLALLAAALAAACVPEDGPPAGGERAAVSADAPKPAFPELGAALPAGHTAYDNASLARLLVSLAYEMEWGDRRSGLVRFEAPVAVELEGDWPASQREFLAGYLAMIARETGIAIAPASGPANLHIRLVPGGKFERLQPTAYCVVAHGDAAWSDYARHPSDFGGVALLRARRFEQMTIFIPDTVPPFQVRYCLLEEIPQAMGLANDLYGLGSSIFNDDAAHIWPTKLDYLMLRVLYDPTLSTGMGAPRAEAAALAVLDRVNPAGIDAPPLPALRPRALDDWPDLMRQVFSREATREGQKRNAEQALAIVEARAPMSAQHCHTLVTAGRVSLEDDPERALALFDRAREVCDAAHGVSDIRRAQIDLNAACGLRSLGRDAEAVRIAEAVWPILAAHGQDERLAFLYTIESDALAATEPDSARASAAARLAAEWSAYALGPGRRMVACPRRN